MCGQGRGLFMYTVGGQGRVWSWRGSTACRQCCIQPAAPEQQLQQQCAQRAGVLLPPPPLASL